MLESVLITASQTAVLFLLMSFGVLSRKFRIFDAETIKRLTEFLICFITPCLIITSFQQPYDGHKVAGLAWSFAGAVFATTVAIILANVFISDSDPKHKRSLRWATVFSNCGYMGIPLEEAIFGAEGVFYGIAAIAVFNIFAWTYGVLMMGGDLSSKSAVKGVLNPANISVAVAIPLFFMPFRLPYVLSHTLELVANLNTPVAMIIMGYYLATAKYAPAFRCKATYLMLFFRHFAIPLILLGAFVFCPFIDKQARLASIVPASAPIGVLLTVFAVKYEGDAEFSTALVAVSTIFSILTIPPIIALAQFLI